MIDILCYVVHRNIYLFFIVLSVTAAVPVSASHTARQPRFCVSLSSPVQAYKNDFAAVIARKSLMVYVYIYEWYVETVAFPLHVPLLKFMWRVL